jgi:hypothetical protein
VKRLNADPDKLFSTPKHSVLKAQMNQQVERDSLSKSSKKQMAIELRLCPKPDRFEHRNKARGDETSVKFVEKKSDASD